MTAMNKGGRARVSESDPPSSPLVAILRARLCLMAAIVGIVWLLESTAASGPFIERFGRPLATIGSSVLFVLAFVLAAMLASTRPRRKSRTSSLRASPSRIARIACLFSVALTAYCLASGRATYDPLLGDEARSVDLLALIWAPVALGSAAALLSLQRKFRWTDWLLLVLVAVLASAIGGRTTPGLIAVMVVLRFLVLPAYPSFVPRHVSARVVIGVGLGAIGVALILSFAAANRAQTSGFTDGNLEYYGYSAWPEQLRYLGATLGVIGESAHITHAVVPDVLPFRGFGLIIEDVLSFTPWSSKTITESTIDLYRAAGSVVFVSRPGGTAATFYLLGGTAGVLAGGAAYGWVLLRLVMRTFREGAHYSAAAFLLLASTFVVGMYGTGTPTAVTLLSFGVATAVFLAARLFDRQPTIKKSR